LDSSNKRLVLAALVALPLATTAYAQVDFQSVCTSSQYGSWTTDTYCPDNHPQLVWADTTCACNSYGNCWIQNWQCGGGGGGGGS
jgi:hypothetical protein